jgi:hypothetical protein
MNPVYQTIDMLKKKRPNLKWKKRVKNRFRPVIRPVGREGGTVKRSTRRPRTNKRKGENERNEGELRTSTRTMEIRHCYPARRVKASWYLRAVFSMISGGRVGAGGVLSHSSVSR